MIMLYGLHGDFDRLTSGSSGGGSSSGSTVNVGRGRVGAGSFRPSGFSRGTKGFRPISITPAFLCSANGCVASNDETLGLFKAIQKLMEQVAAKKGWTSQNFWKNTPQTGTIDSTTAANYQLIVNSGAPFGPWTDSAVTTQAMASSATSIANTMAQWLGVAVPLPAAAPPPPQTFACPDGAAVQAGQACPGGGAIDASGTYVPPAPKTYACPDGAAVQAGQACPGGGSIDAQGKFVPPPASDNGQQQQQQQQPKPSDGSPPGAQVNPVTPPGPQVMVMPVTAPKSRKLLMFGLLGIGAGIAILAVARRKK